MVASGHKDRHDRDQNTGLFPDAVTKFLFAIDFFQSLKPNEINPQHSNGVFIVLSSFIFFTVSVNNGVVVLFGGFGGNLSTW